MELTSYEQFRNEVNASQVPVTGEVIERARSGDPHAKEAIILSCVHYIMRVALTFTQQDPRNNYYELISVGNLAAVECLAVALTKRVPVSYLKGCIKMKIKQFVLRQTHTFLLDKDVAMTPNLPVTRDYSWLYEALDKLAPQQIDLISQQFGLFGTKESLYEMSRGLSSNTKGTILYMRLYQALKRLRVLINNSLLVQTLGRPDEASQ